MSVHSNMPRKREPRKPIVRKMLIEAAVRSDLKVSKVIAVDASGLQFECQVLSAHRATAR